MKETPIIMSAESVKAILDGRATQTRRLWGLKPFNHSPDTWIIYANDFGGFTAKDLRAFGKCEIICPYGQVGDRLWVKETYSIQSGDFILYKVNHQLPEFLKSIKWHSSRFMPRWASRILLEITDIRVERLQEISVANALDEGIPDGIPWIEFSKLWDSLNAKRGYGWETNPWVWCLSFVRLK